MSTRAPACLTFFQMDSVALDAAIKGLQPGAAVTAPPAKPVLQLFCKDGQRGWTQAATSATLRCSPAEDVAARLTQVQCGAVHYIRSAGASYVFTFFSSLPIHSVPPPIATIAPLLQYASEGRHLELVDWEDHLEDISAAADWLNPGLLAGPA